MEKKLKNKRIRLIAIVLILLAGAGFGISRLRVEPATYKGSSQKSIVEADKQMQETDARKAASDAEDINKEPSKKSGETEKASDGQSGNKDYTATEENKSNKTVEAGSGSSKGGNIAESNGNSGSGNSGNAGTAGTGNEGNKEDMITVYLSIDCYTLTGDGLSNLVDENLAKYVPADGEILKRTAYQCKRGTSVYDVLYHACRDKGIQIEASYTPLYSGYYVKGINYLYEFHGGSYSGWLYRVNDIFPNYGCSKYFLEEGDEIVWSYTCTEGDVPGTWMR